MQDTTVPRYVFGGYRGMATVSRVPLPWRGADPAQVLYADGWRVFCYGEGRMVVDVDTYADACDVAAHHANGCVWGGE